MMRRKREEPGPFMLFVRGIFLLLGVLVVWGFVAWLLRALAGDTSPVWVWTHIYSYWPIAFSALFSLFAFNDELLSEMRGRAQQADLQFGPLAWFAVFFFISPILCRLLSLLATWWHLPTNAERILGLRFQIFNWGTYLGLFATGVILNILLVLEVRHRDSRRLHG